jgi:hypothetical protein
MRWILIHTLVIILILLLGASPIIVAIIAGTIAEVNGCTLHEGFVNPCVINGKDWGQDLYAMGVLGFFAIGTIPIALIVAAVYLVSVIIVALLQRNRRRKASTELPLTPQ